MRNEVVQMVTTEAVRAVVSASGMSARAVSRSMGKTDTYISSLLSQAERMGADMTASTVAGIGEACGYMLALVPSESVSGGMLVIDPQRKGDAR